MAAIDHLVDAITDELRRRWQAFLEWVNSEGRTCVWCGLYTPWGDYHYCYPNGKPTTLEDILAVLVLIDDQLDTLVHNTNRLRDD